MGEKPYVGSRAIRVVANLALAIGVVAGVAGVGSVVQGALRSGEAVTVPVELRRTVGPGLGPVTAEAPDLPAGSLVTAPPDGWALQVEESTVVEQLLARGGGAVLGLAVLAGTVLLRGLLLSIADGRPFERGNPRRVAGIAALLLGAGVLVPVLPDLAAVVVLERTGQAGPVSPYAATLSWPLLPLAFVPLLLALAEAFRRGASLTDDVRGLV